MSDSMKVDSILSQIRSIRQQTQNLNLGDKPSIDSLQPSQGVATEPARFGDMLQTAIESVNAAQQHSSSLATAYQRGDEDVSITEVMINMQKADVSFKALTEVRNKVVDAYQEVMRMSV
ncbi:MAG: flagellar hook-basal body complex protein FliE [Spongiibacter sp.]|nr:flagellar hook-basal body complex protein FliE [Spongiibacter sp.]